MFFSRNRLIEPKEFGFFIAKSPQETDTWISCLKNIRLDNVQTELNNFQKLSKKITFDFFVEFMRLFRKIYLSGRLHSCRVHRKRKLESPVLNSFGRLIWGNDGRACRSSGGRPVKYQWLSYVPTEKIIKGHYLL